MTQYLGCCYYQITSQEPPLRNADGGWEVVNRRPAGVPTTAAQRDLQTSPTQSQGIYTDMAGWEVHMQPELCCRVRSPLKLARTAKQKGKRQWQSASCGVARPKKCQPAASSARS